MICFLLASLQRDLKPICFSLLLFLAVGLSACTEQEPVKIGFVGGLTGRYADLGLGGRNGATLAVEEQNRQGGIGGQEIQLVVLDDKQNPELARDAVTKLLELNVDAIIGPLTSAMSKATVPLVNKMQTVMISPCTTTEDLTGLDDYFFRVVSSTSHYAKDHAVNLYRLLKLKNISVIYDLGNKSFVESYLKDFRSAFENEGGRIERSESFYSGETISFYDLAMKTISSETEGILIIASATDTAVLCQQIRKINPSIKLATSEWSATEKLVELGGKAVEGIYFHQFIDRDSTATGYLKFRSKFIARFNTEPGFSAVAGYDSTNMALQGLANRKGRTLKEALLAIASFPGSQGKITIDRYGDTNRRSYLSTIKNGRFVVMNTE